MRGGYRENSGRKKGFSAIEAEKAREFIVERVSLSLDPIIAKLIDLAKLGDIRATQLLFDRAYGKPLTPIETTGEAPKMVILDDSSREKQLVDELRESIKQNLELFRPSPVGTAVLPELAEPVPVKIVDRPSTF